MANLKFLNFRDQFGCFDNIEHFLPGIIIRLIGRWQARDFRKGATILKLAANVMKVTGGVGDSLGLSKTGTVDEVSFAELGG